MSSDIGISQNEWLSTKCDKYDIFIAVSCGALAGLIDIFFVGALGNVPGIEIRDSKLGKITDQMADDFVKKFAGLIGWNPKPGNEKNIGSAINYLERRYKVNYDQTSLITGNYATDMCPKNHHYKSLSHAPDVIGLFFSVLDQFMNTSSFADKGRIIRVDTRDNEFRLEGNDLLSKLYCGFCNWLGHLISDMAGSSNRRKENSGRGMGISLPFTELFQLSDWGQIGIGNDRYTLAMLMVNVYESGYDFRSGIAASIPVVLEELMIRVLWALKRHFYERKTWKECIPVNRYSDLRVMLLIGNTAFCLLDFGEAAMHAGMTGGNPVVFIVHLNIPAWTRLVILVFRELRLCCGACVDQVCNRFLQEILYYETNEEKKNIIEFYRQIQEANESTEKLLKAYEQKVEEKYRKINSDLKSVFDETKSIDAQMEICNNLAKKIGVSDSKIIRNREEMDRRMSRGNLNRR